MNKNTMSLAQLINESRWDEKIRQYENEGSKEEEVQIKTGEKKRCQYDKIR